MPLTNLIPGPPASVLAATLVDGGAFGLSYGQSGRVTINGAGPSFPDLPSLMTDVVSMTGSATLDLNMALTGMLVSQGWATQGITPVTSAYTTLPSDAVILADATSGAFTVTLADATGPGYVVGQRYTIVKTDASGHNVTVAGSAGQLIGGASTQTLTTASAFVSVVFDGANWWVWAASATASLSPPVTLSGSTTGFGGLLTITQTHTPVTSASLGITLQAAGDAAWGIEVAADTNQRLKANGDGSLHWGSGAATGDTNLYRSAANTLKTDDDFIAAGGLTIGTTAVNLPAAPAAFAPANPSSTTSTVQVMMGLGSTCTYTAAGSGHVLANISGTGRTNTTATLFQVGARYGTGTAPANGAALTGTRVPAGTGDPNFQSTVTTGGGAAFCLQSLVSLTTGTAYWFDVALSTSNGSDAAVVTNVSVTLAETLA